MIDIDGSFGEGGGQILRTSLSLSLITHTPFRLRNIRQRRAKPGLQRQHLTAVRAAAALGRAAVTGDAVGSSELSFTPGQVMAGDYHFPIGTAGSTSLVFQTVLPPLLMARGSSELLLEGGTHNTGAPPFDFIAGAVLPHLRAMNARVDIALERHGFVPAGGGRWRARIEGGRALRPLELHHRGEVRRCLTRALLSRLPDHIAQREIDTISATTGWRGSIERVDAVGQGNVVLIEVESDSGTEVFTGFGERGLPAETVARRALDCAQEYLRSDVPVGEHLADQLLLPLALAGGGSFTTLKPTLHSTTNAEVIAMFLPVRIAFEPAAHGGTRVSLSSCAPS